MEYWKYRESDFNIFEYNRNVQLHCATLDQIEMFRFLGLGDNGPVNITNVELSSLTKRDAENITTTAWQYGQVNKRAVDMDEEVLRCADQIDVEIIPTALMEGRDIMGTYTKMLTTFNGFPQYYRDSGISVGHPESLITHHRTYLYYCDHPKCNHQGWVLGKREQPSTLSIENIGGQLRNVYAESNGLRLFLRHEGNPVNPSVCPCDIKDDEKWYYRQLTSAVKNEGIYPPWLPQKAGGIKGQGRTTAWAMRWTCKKRVIRICTILDDKGEDCLRKCEDCEATCINDSGVDCLSECLTTCIVLCNETENPETDNCTTEKLLAQAVSGAGEVFVEQEPLNVILKAADGSSGTSGGAVSTPKAPKATSPPVFDGALTDSMFASTMDQVARLTDRMTKRMETFDKNFDENTNQLMAQAEADLNWLSDPFKPMTLNMNPGAGIGANGQLIQAPSFEMQLKKASSPQDNWGESMGASKKPALMSTSLGEMMINECYRKNRFLNHIKTAQVLIDPDFGNRGKRNIGVKQQNQDTRFFAKNANFLYDPNDYTHQSVGDDVACPLADNILNACKDIIDAAQYIGVTFDIRKGYNTEGYRSQLVLMWCSWKKKFANNKFDVPDFMHVQGLYETKMSTESFNTIEEYAQIISQRSNTKMGDAAFAEDTAKVSASKSSSTSSSESGSLGTPVAALEYSTDRQSSSSDGQQINQFSRSEGTNKQNTINDKKSKSVNKVETMIAEMSIKILRYQEKV